MITKEIEINGTKFNLTLTDQVINQVDRLKSLYATAAEDPEIFEQVSSEISSTINDISSAVTPEVSDGNLDGLIQQVFKAVDDKKSEVEKQIKDKDSKIPRKKRPFIPILINGNDDIIWIYGERISDLFRVDKTTKKVLLIEGKVV